MADKTGIRWTSATWNPVVGCTIESPACTNCYAMEQAHRILRMSAAVGRASHYEGTTELAKGKPVWTGLLADAPEHIVLQPIRWSKPRMVFVNSMSDLFHPDMPRASIDTVFAVMRLSGRHVFQILTKRPAVMLAWMSDPETPARVSARAREIAAAVDPKGRIPKETVEDGTWPPRNVWLGCTVEDQKRADQRVAILLSTPAVVRFVSIEPMLSMVDLRHVAAVAEDGRTIWFDALDPSRAGLVSDGVRSEDGDLRPRTVAGVLPALDWIIVGGESGDRARPMHPDWPRRLRDDCEATGRAYFFKQWGAWTVAGDGTAASERFVDVHGGRDPTSVSAVAVRKGRQVEGVDDVLDGREHKAFPLAA